MTFRQRFSIQAAMEQIEEQQTQDDLAVAEATDAVVNPEEVAETDMIEMTEAAAEVEGGQAEVESAATDTETLDAIADTMENTEEQGGVNEVTAEIAQVAVEALYARLHVTRRKPLPAMEAFGSQSSRVKATKLAVEGIRETVKKAWNAILAMLAKIGEFLKKMYDSVFSSVAKLGERAKAVLAKVKGSNGVEAVELSDEEYAKWSGIFAAAANKDGVVDAVEIEKNLDAASKTVDAVAKATDDVVKAAEGGKTVKALAEAGEGGLDGAESVAAALGGEAAKETDGTPEGMKTVTIGEEMFGAEIQADVPAEGATGEAAVAGDAKSKVKLFIKSKAEKVTKVVSASKDKLVSMLEKVIEVLAKVTKAKQISDAAGKAYDKVTASAKSGANKAKEAMTAGVKALQRWATSVVNFITRPFALLGNLIARACKATVDYAEVLVNKVKGKKAEGEKAE